MIGEDAPATSIYYCKYVLLECMMRFKAVVLYLRLLKCLFA